MKDYTEAEVMIALCARLLEDQKTAFIGFGMPQVAAILAQRIQAPQLVQVFEFGAIGPTPLTPFVRNTKGVFGFDEDSKKMTLLGVLQGITPEQVLAEMELKPLVAPRVETLKPPTEQELRILREEIDPARTIIGRTAKAA